MKTFMITVIVAAGCATCQKPQGDGQEWISPSGTPCAQAYDCFIATCGETFCQDCYDAHPHGAADQAWQVIAACSLDSNKCEMRLDECFEEPVLGVPTLPAIPAQ